MGWANPLPRCPSREIVSWMPVDGGVARATVVERQRMDGRPEVVAATKREEAPVGNQSNRREARCCWRVQLASRP